MARQRSGKGRSGNTATTGNAQVVGEPDIAAVVKETQLGESVSNTANNGTSDRRVIMGGLTPEQIQALLGASRSKGQYIVYLNKFIDSGEGGVCVNDEWVDLADKKPATLKQGFENAKTNKEAGEGAENVKVMVNEEKVYLINLATAGVAAEDAEAA